jgi:hypothetical protein
MRPPLFSFFFVLILSGALRVARCHIKVSVANHTAVDLATAIAGRGVIITDAKFADCGPDQEGIFANGELDIKFDNGIVLSSAVASEVEGPNDDVYPSGDRMMHVGSSLLDQILPNGKLTKDACTLHINFECDDAAHFGFGFVFGSDNYPSNGTTQYEDVMGAFLNGVRPENNVALYNGTYISVNTLYGGGMYKNNSQDTYDCEMNGFTYPIRVGNSKKLARNGSNEIWFSVADGYDPAKRAYNEIYFSPADRNDPNKQHPGAFKKGAWLFVRRQSLRCADDTVTVPAWKMTPKLCARQAVSICHCHNWSCLDRYATTRCVRGGTNAEVNDYKTKVRARINRRECNGL